jgi:hypothetical protein
MRRIFSPQTIWQARQNNPELVVEDLKEEFNLNGQQCQAVRYSLMIRGVNKWLLVRRRFLELKHDVKEMVKAHPENRELQLVYARMHEMANTPRWVEWPATLTHNWKNIEEEIYVAGKHC